MTLCSKGIEKEMSESYKTLYIRIYEKFMKYINSNVQFDYRDETSSKLISYAVLGITHLCRIIPLSIKERTSDPYNILKRWIYFKIENNSEKSSANDRRMYYLC